MAWFDEAVFYHIYPLGLTGAPKQNEYGEVVHRLKEVYPWIDHLKKIGVNGLYIGPLFESVGHGYETTDYKKLDSRLGTNEDFKKDNELDFEDMISVDEDMIKEAFQVNISEDDFSFDVMSEADMTKLITTTSATVYNDINNQANQVAADFALKNICLGAAKGVITTAEGTLISQGAYNTMYAQLFATAATNPQVFKMILGASASMFSDNDINNLVSATQAIINEYFTTLNSKVHTPMTCIYDANGVATYTDEETTPNVYTSTELYDGLTYQDADTYITPLIPVYIKNVSIGLIAKGMGETTAKIMAPLVKSLEGLGDLFGEDMMTIDTDKFAAAFKFDMSEDELSRLMETMLSGTEEKSYKSNLISLGYQDVDDPTSISFYFKDFEAKENFINFLKDYNEKAEDEDKEIRYTDITGILMSSVKTIVDSVTYVLIAFVSISLVVSSIMIAVITLISVMERTKEIGILRAMGASKHNVSSIFNAETFIIGLLSGLLGVGVTFAAIPPINSLIHNVTGNYDINAVLPTKYAIILVFISVFLTIIAGIIPSRKASKQDPVIALRTE